MTWPIQPKKTADVLQDVLDVISHFAEYGTTYLGLNENETLKLCQILSKNQNPEDRTLNEKARFIFGQLKFHGLLIYPTNRYLLINRERTLEVDGKVVPEPKISTGGGDNLNAGFYTGYLLGLEGMELMIFTMATSGAYARIGASPDLVAILAYLSTW